MSSPIRACSLCGESFWSIGPQGTAMEVCPICAGLSTAPPEEATEVDEGPPRFVSLSALPPEKRLLPRRDGTRPGLFVPRRLEAVAGAVALRPEEPAPLPADHSSMQLSASPQLGFNCPSCYTVLYIKDPQQYDGRAAPCPHCSVTILPPRVAPPSPFLLIAPPPAVPSAPPLPTRAGRWKPFRRDEFWTEQLQPAQVA